VSGLSLGRSGVVDGRRPCPDLFRRALVPGLQRE
jgi:hypothetical protein